MIVWLGTWSVVYTHPSVAAETSCPSTDDIAYSTQAGETWFSLGGRAYCLDGPGDRSRAALALYEYNRGRVGPSASDLPEGINVCLPKYLHGSFFDATRCRSAPATDVRPSAPSEPITVETVAAKSVCSNGVREETEWCDGADMGDRTCASMNLPGGVLRCNADCRGFDASDCAVKPAQSERNAPSETVKPREESGSFTRISLAVDVGGGVLFPLAEKTRDALYGPIGLAHGGARLTFGWVEFGLHGFFGGNSEVIQTRPVAMNRRLSTVGAGLQVGAVMGRGPLRLIPGLEVSRFLAQQTSELPQEFNRIPGIRPIPMTLFGAFLRMEYRFKRFPSLIVNLEVAVDYQFEIIGIRPPVDNVQMKTLGGLSYVAF